MKKFLAVLLSVMMIASVCAFQVSAEYAAGKTVYVGGDPTLEEKGTGTKDDPFSKMSLAIKALAQSGGTIVLLNDVDLGYEYATEGAAPDANTLGATADTAYHYVEPTHPAYITVTSVDPSAPASIKMTAHRAASSWTIGGPTVYTGVKFSFVSPGTYKRVYTNGYNVIFDTASEPASNGCYFYPGISPYATDKNTRIVKSQDVVFKSGTYDYLFGACDTNCADTEYTVYVLNDACIKGYASVGPMSGKTVKSANLVYDTTATLPAVHAGHTFEGGTVNVYVRNGEVTSISAKAQSKCESFEAMNVYYTGGKIGSFTGTGSTAKAVNLYVAKGIEAPTTADVAVAELKNVVYVDGAGKNEDKGDGSFTAPFSKISQAIKALGDKDGEIVLTGVVDLAYECVSDPSASGAQAMVVDPAHKGKIIIRAIGDGAIDMTVNRAYCSWSMGGDTEFQSVCFLWTNKYTRMFANAYNMTFGWGSSLATDAAQEMYVYPGLSQYALADDVSARKGAGGTITSLDGTWNYFFGAKRVDAEEAANVGCSYTFNVLGCSSWKGYVELGGMDGTNVDTVNLNVNTAGIIGTLYTGYSGNVKNINVEMKSGEIQKILMGTPSGNCEVENWTANFIGGNVSDTFAMEGAKTASTIKNNAVYVADGLKLTAAPGSGFNVKAGIIPADVKVADVKLGNDVVVSLDGKYDVVVMVFKKGHKLGDEDIDDEFTKKVLDDEGNPKKDDEGKEILDTITFGAPLMKAAAFAGDTSVTLNASCEGTLKKREIEALAEGEYDACFYLASAAEPFATVTFKVAKDVKPVDPPKPDNPAKTGDEIVWIAIATLISAMAAAVILRKKRI